jgi:RNA-directed DNA polymerase
MADETNTQCSKRTEDWNRLPWKDIQKNVFRLQRRIYGNATRSLAASQNDTKRVHDLQRLLLRSWSARCLAVRRVTQDNAYASHP